MATQTSIEAYAHVSGTQTELVGMALLHRTRKGLRSSDRDISDLTGLPCGEVSARRKNLIETPLFSDGFYWKPFLFQSTKVDRVTGRRVQTWAMLIYRDGSNAMDLLAETNFHLNIQL
jgi:hypothetical protein